MDVKIGYEVWHTDSWGNVHSGRVIETDLPVGQDGAVYCRVKGTRDSYGTCGVDVEECYPTKDALLAAMQEESDRRVQEFCGRIGSVQDLVQFCYDNTVATADEYTDWDARKAVRIRAQELLGMDLEPGLAPEENPLSLTEGDLEGIGQQDGHALE